MNTNVEIIDDRFSRVIGPAPVLERIASGFQFLEGPIWHPVKKHLVFSDIPGDTLYRWEPTSGVSVLRRPSNKANGNAYDRLGRIVTCEHETSRVVRQEADGRIVVLASHYRGRELNSPNDVVVRRAGAIYFTDPDFGRRYDRVGRVRPPQLSFQGVFRLDPETADLRCVADDFGNPNGLCFSLDETQLYVNDSPRGHIRVFDVRENGTLAGGNVWTEVIGEGPGVPDGMKIDSAQNLYCAGPGGIYVFDKDANLLGRLNMPEQTANFAWGDDDLRGLYITASTALYRLRVAVPGLPAF